MSRRNYRSSLTFVTDAFRACWENAQDLVAESKLLLDNGHTARALSLSILALEELGKLFCVDGLLYARQDDHKAKAFAKSLKSHSAKLSALEMLPLLLHNISSTDPRHGVEKRFMQANAICTADLVERGNAVFALLDGDGFSKLDQWKQTGFYSHALDNSFVKPNNAVNVEISTAVYMLAWRAASNLDFLFKNGGLERYIGTARQTRSSLKEDGHAEISAVAEEIANLLFPPEASEDNEESLH